MDVTKSRTADPTRIRADVVVIPVADPPGTLAGPLAAVDTALGGLVSAVIKDGEVTGKAGQVRVLQVLALATRRGPASEAATLYREIPPAGTLSCPGPETAPYPPPASEP